MNKRLTTFLLDDGAGGAIIFYIFDLTCLAGILLLAYQLERIWPSVSLCRV
nr:hypothetical protein [Paenibacillus polymyxa]